MPAHRNESRDVLCMWLLVLLRRWDVFFRFIFVAAKFELLSNSRPLIRLQPLSVP